VISGRLALAALLVVLGFGLHMIDRGYAVRQATTGLIDELEAKTAKAEAARLLRLTAITQKLNRDLAAQKADADLSLAALEKEIQDYERQNTIGSDCVVTEHLLDRLR
jgi:hypothetical protein